MIPNYNNSINTERQNNYLTLFWLGFIIYIVSYVFTYTQYDISFKVFQSSQLLGLILVFFTAFQLVRFDFSNKYLKVIFTLYYFWILVIIIRGFTFEYNSIKYLLFSPTHGIMPYFVPLILFFPDKIIFHKKIFSVIILLGLFFIIYIVITLKAILNSPQTDILSRGIVEYSSLLSIPVGFLLLTYKYHKIERRIFAIVIILVTLFFAIYKARRGLIFICSSQIIFASYLYLINSKNKFFIIFFSIVITFFAFNYTYSTLLKKDNPIFGFLMERGTEDTRSYVELAFYSDFELNDWIFGRGINGTYYCPGIEDNVTHRNVIETGFLQIVLTGGLINFFLILFIALPAIFLGLFYSKNTFSKAMGLWIFLWVLYLYPANMQAFSLYYLIFWSSISICYSKNVRKMSDNNILMMLNIQEKKNNRILFKNYLEKDQINV